MFKELTVLDRFLLLTTVIGALILITGVIRGIVSDSQVQVEYLESENGRIVSKIMVDVAGAVEKPGVYELNTQSRVKDALVLAGGLSKEADRSFIEKNINLAEILKDGEKIYIPKQTESQVGVGYTEANNASNKVNINTSSESELDTLQGIGSIRAKDIVANRPYKSIDDLIEKGILSKSIVDKIRDSLSTY